MALVRKFNLKWNHVFLVLSVFGVCSNHSVSILLLLKWSLYRRICGDPKKVPQKTTGFTFLLQILIRLLSRWLMNVSVSLHLLRHFKLRSDTSSWDPRICPRMGHSSPRLWTSYYWPTVSQTLLISCKLVSLEEKHQWYFITVNPKCPGLRIKNSSSDGQRTIYVNGSYI